MKDLERQIEALKKELKDKVGDLNEKRKTNAQIKSDVNSKEKELRFKVNLKSKEVTAERTKTNMEEIKEKQEESYKIWIMKQLDQLREMYEKQKVDVEATMRDMYVKKVKNSNQSKLKKLQMCSKEKSVPYQIPNWVPSGSTNLSLVFGRGRLNICPCFLIWICLLHFLIKRKHVDSVRCDEGALQVEKLTAEKTKAEKEKVDNKVKKIFRKSRLDDSNQFKICSR